MLYPGLPSQSFDRDDLEKSCDVLESSRKHFRKNKLDEATEKLDEMISAMCVVDAKGPSIEKYMETLHSLVEEPN